MLLNYLKITLRLFLQQRLYNAINIIGLAIGLACCILILLYVRFELSYENQFSKALVEDFAAIETAGRINLGGTVLVQGEQTLTEHELRFTDQEILRVFDFEWLAGDGEIASSRYE